MKLLKLIPIKGYLVAVSDAIPNEGALVVHEDEDGCHELMYCNNRTGHGLKIEGYLPLEENLPPLKGIEFLPPLEEDDVEKLADETYPETYYSGIYVDGWLKAGFIKGYNKAKEKYSLSNIIDLYIEETGYGMDMWSKEENEVMTTVGKIIQSLSQPKMPIAFECEVEELFAEDGKTKVGEDLAVEIIEGFTAYLSGKYIYE